MHLVSGHSLNQYEVHIDNSLAGPDLMVFGKSQLVGHGTKEFVITVVAAGSTVEKWMQQQSMA